MGHFGDDGAKNLFSNAKKTFTSTYFIVHREYDCCSLLLYGGILKSLTFHLLPPHVEYLSNLSATKPFELDEIFTISKTKGIYLSALYLLLSLTANGGM